MLTKAFLSPAEIEERIAQEAASDKDRKLTPEQIELFTVMVLIFWYLPQLVQGKPLSWLSVSLI